MKKRNVHHMRSFRSGILVLFLSLLMLTFPTFSVAQLETGAESSGGAASGETGATGSGAGAGAGAGTGVGSGAAAAGTGAVGGGLGAAGIGGIVALAAGAVGAIAGALGGGGGGGDAPTQTGPTHGAH